MRSNSDDNGALILVCADSLENDAVKGRFYYGGLDHEGSFSGLSNLLIMLDRLQDGMRREEETFVENTSPIWRIGKLATFRIRIMFRQNESWQGSVMWLETRHEEQFRSALELLSIFQQTLRPSLERRMRPSSLRIANRR